MKLTDGQVNEIWERAHSSRGEDADLTDDVFNLVINLQEAREEIKRLKEENKRLHDNISEAISIWECMDMEDDSIDTIERVIEKLKQALPVINSIQEGIQG